MKKQLVIIRRFICLFIYYTIAQFLPNSYCFIPIIGRISNAIRVHLCKGIFKKSGKIATINRRVHFGTGSKIEIGDGSGIGEAAHLPANTIIGNNVMISRNTFILDRNHRFDSITTPIVMQGFLPAKQTIIEDDCWIGLRCILTPGRHVSEGTIVGMGSVLTKDFPPYSIVGGAPAKLIKSRMPENDR